MRLKKAAAAISIFSCLNFVESPKQSCSNRGIWHSMNNDRVELYRANASKCAGLAKNASDIQSKLTLLEMARAWLLLADRALKNGQTCLVYEPPMPSLRELERQYFKD